MPVPRPHGVPRPATRAAARARVLVVEDDATLRDSLRATLRASGFGVAVAASVPEALWALSKTSVDVTLSDLRIGGPGGRDLVRRLREGSPDTPHVLLTAPENLPSAVACLRDGVSELVLKPAEPLALEVAFRRALDARATRRELAYFRQAARDEAQAVAGEGEAWRRALTAVDAVAGSERAVLLRGAWSAGASHLAFRLHERSTRAHGPFVRVNAAALRSDTWESEIFGHRKGAFPGAATDHEGLLHAAAGGTLLVRDVAALPPLARAKLRRLLEEGLFERPGEVQPSAAAVRLVLTAAADVTGLPEVVRIDVPPAPSLPVQVEPAPAAEPLDEEVESATLNLRESLHRAERGLLLEALRRAGGVQREAARLLGVDARNLPYFLRKYGLTAHGERG
jgi:DNA-binding NtrC family response regulator